MCITSLIYGITNTVKPVIRGCLTCPYMTGVPSSQVHFNARAQLVHQKMPFWHPNRTGVPSSQVYCIEVSPPHRFTVLRCPLITGLLYRGVPSSQVYCIEVSPHHRFTVLRCPLITGLLYWGVPSSQVYCIEVSPHHRFTVLRCPLITGFTVLMDILIFLFNIGNELAKK